MKISIGRPPCSLLLSAILREDAIPLEAVVTKRNAELDMNNSRPQAASATAEASATTAADGFLSIVHVQELNAVFSGEVLPSVQIRLFSVHSN